VQPLEAGGFFDFKALKWLKIDTKHLKNAKINDTNLYYNFSSRFLKTYFSIVGPVPPLAPPRRVTYAHRDISLQIEV